MSADKHKSLASRAAYLRLAIQREGFAVNVKWAHALTPFIMRMIDEGELVMRRRGEGGGKRVSTIHATEAGIQRLAALEARFGTDFGSKADIGRVEPKRLPKSVRQRITNMEPRHVAAARKAVRTARLVALQNRLKANAYLHQAAQAA